MNETCNYIVQFPQPESRKRPGVPQRSCGKPATVVMLPNRRLYLCADHAKENWGNSVFEKLESVAL